MALKNYRAVTNGQSLGDAAIVTFAWTGNSLRPLAPVNLRASRNSAGDVLFEWTRRSRTGAGFRPGSDVPLAEEREYFLVEIYSGSTIKRSARVPLFKSEIPIWEIVRNDNNATVTISADGSVHVTGTAIATTPYIKLVSKQILSPESSIFAFDADTRIPTGAGTPMPMIVGMTPLSVPIASIVLVGAAFNKSQDTSFPGSVPYVWGASSPVVELAKTRLSLQSMGHSVRYFQDAYDYNTSPPIGTQELPFEESSRVFILHKLDQTWTYKDAEIKRPVISRDSPSFLYSVADQTVDFGSTQSSIKIRVYQYSQIVGKGAYIEGTL